MQKYIIFLILIGTILSLSINHTSGQNFYNDKFRLAQTFESNGDYINAARLYRELYDEDKRNEKYFLSYVRAFKKQDRYSELIPFVEEHVKIIPSSDTYILLGELYWREGKPDKAQESWEKAVESNKTSLITYSKLGDSQMMLRLFQKAIDTYLLARSNLDDDDIFADRLSQLYAITGDYKNGTEEVLNLFRKTNNPALAQGRISALAINEEAKGFIYQILEDKSSGGDINLKRLFAWYSNNIGKFEQALNLYEEIDDAINARGAEVYNFALNSSNDGNYDIAVKAYQWIIEKGQTSPYTVTSLFRMAKALELKYDASGALDKKASERIIKKYRDVIKDYPNTPTSHECMYNIALLYLRQKEFDKAIPELEQLTVRANYSNLGAKANFLLGDIYFMKDEVNNSLLTYTKNVTLFKRHTAEYHSALYAMAEIEYFRGHLDSALAKFRQLIKLTNSDVANDALEKINLIEENKNLNKALALYSSGEKLEKQQRYTDALQKFIDAAKASIPEELYDLSMIKAATMSIKLKNNNKAKSYLEELLKEKPDGIHSDYCIFTLAKINYSDGNNDRAVKLFTTLLREYPKSIYNEKARDIIREIRTEKD